MQHQHCIHAEHARTSNSSPSDAEQAICNATTYLRGISGATSKPSRTPYVLVCTCSYGCFRGCSKVSDRLTCLIYAALISRACRVGMGTGQWRRTCSDVALYSRPAFANHRPQTRSEYLMLVKVRPVGIEIPDGRICAAGMVAQTESLENNHGSIERTQHGVMKGRPRRMRILLETHSLYDAQCRWCRYMCSATAAQQGPASCEVHEGGQPIHAGAKAFASMTPNAKTPDDYMQRCPDSVWS